MDVLSLDTANEADEFLAICLSHIDRFEEHTHVGGMTLTPKDPFQWYWVDSGEKIFYPLRFKPGQPDNSGDKEMCLGIQKHLGAFAFNDIACSGWESKFICQLKE